jgi:transposase-like protein
MKRRPTSTAEERAKTIEEFRQSGLSVTEFARQKGISRTLLSVWLMRCGQPLPVLTRTAAPESLRWQEATLPELLGSSDWAAEVVLPGGITVRLDAQGQTQLLGYLHRHLNRC